MTKQSKQYYAYILTNKKMGHYTQESQIIGIGDSTKIKTS